MYVVKSQKKDFLEAIILMRHLTASEGEDFCALSSHA